MKKQSCFFRMKKASFFMARSRQSDTNFEVIIHFKVQMLKNVFIRNDYS